MLKALVFLFLLFCCDLQSAQDLDKLSVRQREIQITYFKKLIQLKNTQKLFKEAWPWLKKNKIDRPIYQMLFEFFWKEGQPPRSIRILHLALVKLDPLQFKKLRSVPPKALEDIQFSLMKNPGKDALSFYWDLGRSYVELSEKEEDPSEKDRFQWLSLKYLKVCAQFDYQRKEALHHIISQNIATKRWARAAVAMDQYRNLLLNPTEQEWLGKQRKIYEINDFSSLEKITMRKRELFHRPLFDHSTLFHSFLNRQKSLKSDWQSDLTLGFQNSQNVLGQTPSSDSGLGRYLHLATGGHYKFDDKGRWFASGHFQDQDFWEESLEDGDLNQLFLKSGVQFLQEEDKTWSANILYHRQSSDLNSFTGRAYGALGLQLEYLFEGNNKETLFGLFYQSLEYDDFSVPRTLYGPYAQGILPTPYSWLYPLWEVQLLFQNNEQDESAMLWRFKLTNRFRPSSTWMGRVSFLMEVASSELESEKYTLGRIEAVILKSSQWIKGLLYHLEGAMIGVSPSQGDSIAQSQWVLGIGFEF